MVAITELDYYKELTQQFQVVLEGLNKSLAQKITVCVSGPALIIAYFSVLLKTKFNNINIYAVVVDAASVPDELDNKFIYKRSLEEKWISSEKFTSAMKITAQNLGVRFFENTAFMNVEIIERTIVTKMKNDSASPQSSEEIFHFRDNIIFTSTYAYEPKEANLYVTSVNDGQYMIRVIMGTESKKNIKFKDLENNYKNKLSSLTGLEASEMNDFMVSVNNTAQVSANMTKSDHIIGVNFKVPKGFPQHIYLNYIMTQCMNMVNNMNENLQLSNFLIVGLVLEKLNGVSISKII